MERKKIIAVAALAIGIIAWRMGAMQGEQGQMIALVTNDGKKTSIAKDRAMLFGTVKDLMEDLPDETEMPVRIQTQAALQMVIDDLPWVLRVLGEKRADETEQQAVERIVKPMLAVPFNQAALEQLIAKVNVAVYLYQPALLERYTKEIADILTSDDSMRRLARNDTTIIDQVKAALSEVVVASLSNYIFKEYWIAGLTLQGHTGEVTSALFSADEKRIITGSRDCTGRIWDAHTGGLIRTLQHDPKISAVNYVESAELSLDGKMALTASWNGIAKIWDASTGELLRELKNLVSERPVYFCWGGKVVAACDDFTAKIWDVKTENPVSTWEKENQPADVWRRKRVDLLKVSSDGSKVMTHWDEDDAVSIWNAETGHRLRTLKHPGAAEGVMVLQVNFSSDGTKVVMLSSEKTGVLHRDFQVTARIWDVATGLEERGLIIKSGNDGSEGVIAEAKFSQDGSKLVTVYLNAVKIWDTNTGQLLLELPQETATGHWTNRMIQDIAFSPSGNELVTVGRNNLVKIWDLTKSAGQQPLVLKGHTDTIWSVKFSRDGNKILTASFDKTAKIWAHLPSSLPGISDFETCLFERLLFWAKENNQKILREGWAGNILRSIIWRDVEPIAKKTLQTLIRETMQHAGAQE